MSGADLGRSTAEPLTLHERASATPVAWEDARRGVGRERAAATGGAEPVSLAEKQGWFARAVMTPESEPLPAGANLAAAVLTPGPRLSALDRLEIYRRGYHARLIECLLDDYPAVAAAIGTDRFEGLGRGYIARHPSRGPNLNTFGERFSAYCREADLDPTERSFCAELAQLEWAIVEVIHAAAAAPLTMEGLAHVPSERWADAGLVATPAFRLLSFTHPVNRHYQVFRQGASPSPPALEPSAVAVYRSGATIWRMDLSPAAFSLIEALSSGRSLGASLEEAIIRFPDAGEAEAAAIVSQWFRDWVQSGLFCSVEVK